MLSALSISITLLAITLMATPVSAKKPPVATWGFELRLGSYEPTLAETQQYQQHFGNDSDLLMSVEFDRYLTYLLGNFGVFMQVGLWKDSGKSRSCADAAGATVSCSSASVVTNVAGSQKEKMQLIPLSVGAMYRMDLLKRHLNVPLVPYAKVGFNAVYWSHTAGGKSSSFADGSSGDGWSTGFHGAVGVGLNLDWISTDYSDEHRLFIDSFFFAEVIRLWADGFGEAIFDMSDTQVTFGLAFDFD
ncbi:MAG: hypothetical protein A2289_17205 [Deltaproteobacteria bacterium RIFOXYA12_FULL_58_15]|nr:MAG: hypothetical protein A2289_17205 [Deltaproteobacteria bacterium RIFOXYA12_FULL_58_15]